MSLIKEFQTNANQERDGVWCEINESTQVKLCRAGGGNTRYEKMYLEKTKPIRRRLASGNIPLDRLRQITMDCFLKTVIVGWKTKLNGAWHDGIEPFTVKGDTIVAVDCHEAADLLPVTEENLRNLLTGLPELFDFVKNIAEEAIVFQEENLELEAGN